MTDVLEPLTEEGLAEIETEARKLSDTHSQRGFWQHLYCAPCNVVRLVAEVRALRRQVEDLREEAHLCRTGSHWPRLPRDEEVERLRAVVARLTGGYRSGPGGRLIR